jgi:hypothetical protein
MRLSHEIDIGRSRLTHTCVICCGEDEHVLPAQTRFSDQCCCVECAFHQECLVQYVNSGSHAVWDGVGHAPIGIECPLCRQSREKAIVSYQLLTPIPIPIPYIPMLHPIAPIPYNFTFPIPMLREQQEQAYTEREQQDLSSYGFIRISDGMQRWYLL